MAVTVYASTDGSAPVLNGTAGEFVALLKACLVDGYGSKAAAGWTRPFSGTNKAAFKQAAGNQFYLRVLDHNLTSTTRYAFLRGFETMSDVDTGTGGFPTAAQQTNGLIVNYNTGAVARPWIVIADDRTVYAFCDIAGNATYYAFMFGDIYSYVSSDGYRTALIGMIDNTTDRLNAGYADVTTAASGYYIARKYDGSGTSLQVGVHADNTYVSSSVGKGPIAYPDPVSGGIVLSPVYLHEIAEPTIRGKLRGFWHWSHATSGIGDRDFFNGATGTAFQGKSFLVISLSQAAGLYVMETSNTWQTN